MEKGRGIIIGVCIGAAIGFTFGHPALWMGVGVVLGVLIENGELDDILEDIGFNMKRGTE